jgi:hypothetical protein
MPSAAAGRSSERPRKGWNPFAWRSLLSSERTTVAIVSRMVTASASRGGRAARSSWNGRAVSVGKSKWQLFGWLRDARRPARQRFAASTSPRFDGARHALGRQRQHDAVVVASCRHPSRNMAKGLWQLLEQQHCRLRRNLRLVGGGLGWSRAARTILRARRPGLAARTNDRRHGTAWGALAQR